MKILAAAHDPGGANAVVPVLAELMRRGHEVVALAEGPAREIFSAQGVPLGDCAQPALVLVGTSAGESIDKKVTARMRGVPTVAVLDFWSNYWQRFSSLGVKDFKYLPDLVCVIDDIAKQEMIAEGFPAEKLVVTGNPHFDHFADGITNEGEDSSRILFISQPWHDTAALLGSAPPAHDEYAALETFVTAIKVLPAQYHLSLRLHPRDLAGKYDTYMSERVRLAPEATLEEALSGSGLILGIASPVLMQAAAAGKKVLSYEPATEALDPMVSNRAGVTTRISTPEELASALQAYAAGKWPFVTKPLREVWPAGATNRVADAALALVKRTPLTK